nr:MULTISPECIES: DNA alkylation repair protein [unclassified Rhodococcus (in: high G+C Gram-positive bacteria)]
MAKRVDRSQVVGVRMKHVFDLAKANAHLDLESVRDLLRSRWFESRMVAVSILDARARRKAPGDPERKHLYEDPAARLVPISESPPSGARNTVNRPQPR